MTAPTDDALYRALIDRDPALDGFWYVGVRTTGIFCRLTCPARKPKRENVVFFDRPGEAERAGFRPCLRCRPLDRGRPVDPTLARLRGQVAAEPDRRWTAADLAALGYDPSTVRRAFKREYGVTFAQYARAQRLGAAVTGLRDGAPVIEAQLDAGYASASGFREAVTRLLGEAPARLRGRPALPARWLDTPIGAMLAVADDGGVHLLEFADRTALPRELDRLQRRSGPVLFGQHPMLDRLAGQVERYFAGADLSFDLPVAQAGSAFQAAVWAALRRLPAGATCSYGELARALGRPDAVRAVAGANGANQVAIIVPCHRVVGADGSLVGYGGKPWRKRWLLEHERRHARSTDRGNP
ncbi:MAG TPA: trifunctional transcriptional activator/DNA repair protein Ada/methylated-DNA--[protein]-cysteine S-methyltransferase [Azospirillaceae bacterium]|nr:trifunctional transcriptional activator/DNA repair protein Ada/methylated-DNA--[protein]-cysteine S-methyltransferase [Azospirillaceae bacterium]